LATKGDVARIDGYCAAGTVCNSRTAPLELSMSHRRRPRSDLFLAGAAVCVPKLCSLWWRWPRAHGSRCAGRSDVKVAMRCTVDSVEAERIFKCPSVILVLDSETFRNSGSSNSCTSTTSSGSAIREWLLASVGSNKRVPLHLWSMYQDWVSVRIVGGVGQVDLWHRFACSHLLGISQMDATGVSGGDVGDLLSCMAEAGVLGRGTPEEALTAWLTETFSAYQSPFMAASSRVYKGFGPTEEGEWCNCYDFMQIADPQLGMLHWNKSWSEELSLLRMAVQHANRLKPRFLFVSGDLINMYPRGEGCDPRVTEAQVADFKDAMRELDPSIPLVLQPGNHDVGDHPMPEDIQRYRQRFGDDYYSFWVGGVLYISLNSQYYVDGDQVSALREDHDCWLEQVVSTASSKAQHIVVLSHVPPFVETMHEAQGWSNWPVKHRSRVFDIFAERAITLWLCGHYHANVETADGGTEIVVSASCGGVINWTKPAREVATSAFPDFSNDVGDPAVSADPCVAGIRLVRVCKQRIVHRWFAMDSVPSTCESAFSEAPGVSHGEP